MDNKVYGTKCDFKMVFSKKNQRKISKISIFFHVLFLGSSNKFDGRTSHFKPFLMLELLFEFWDKNS